MRDEKTWAAVNTNVQMPEASDLHFFDTRQAAVDFLDFNRSMQKEIALFPVFITWDAIHEKVNARIKNGIEYPSVTIDPKEMQELNQQFLIQVATGELSQTMDGFDWSYAFYDPLYANTEAESFDDKIDFNRLQCLIEDLSAFAQSGEQAHAAVEEMLNHYWIGQPMEGQIADVLNGRILNNASTHLNINIMNDKNLEFLKGNIKYTGFGESLYGELEKNIREGKPEFQLHFSTQIYNKPFDAVLDFKKGDKGDMYFYNGYRATFERSDGKKMEHYFDVEKGKGIAGKEAYNLLQGRAIVDKKQIDHLDKEAREALVVKPWIQFDLSKKGENGYAVIPLGEERGYNLREAVGKFAVIEMDGSTREKDLIKALEKGNMQAATIEINGKVENIYLSANPEYKTVNVYDDKFKLMKHEALPLREGVGVAQGRVAGQAVAGENKQGMAQEVKQDVKQGQKPGMSKKKDNSLLPKKRTGKKNKMKI
ncbi:MAG: hypothetical protein V4539_01385 [Bacteroidota bacterium]